MKLNKIKAFAIDSDGVLLNDTYSPAIKIFVEQHGVKYTSEIERSVWGSPQVTAGHNLALACKLPFSGNHVINEFFKVREQYLRDHPVTVMPGIEKVLKMMSETGARLICYGGRNKEYSFDKFLAQQSQYFDKETPYIDINEFRPGVNEIVSSLGLNFNEVVFIDDINRVAEVCKALGTGFIGIPASMPHNFQQREMQETGVKFSASAFCDITEEMLTKTDKNLAHATLWE
ncbi:hypothetical protein D3C73_227850 [compost metagenome]|nr:HAD family hydrolase [Serratia fonticola]